MKIFKFCLGTFMFLSMNLLFGQVGIGTLVPDSNSMLDITSSSKGLLMPRVDFNNLPSDPVSAPGLLVYVTANGPQGSNQFYYYNGTDWKKLNSPSEITWQTITNTPSTLAGYGITDAMPVGGFTAGAEDFIGTVNEMPLVMKSNNEEALRITPYGKVGIGTDNPDDSATVTIKAEGSEHPLKLENLQVSSPPQHDFLVVDQSGNVSRRQNPLGGLNNITTWSATLSVPVINNNSSYQTTISVPGAQPGAGVVIGPEIDLSGYGGTVVLQGWVQSPGNVCIKWANVSNAKAFLPTSTYHLLIFQ